MYIRCDCHGGHLFFLFFFLIMKDMKVTLFGPLCIVYVKFNVQDILYNFIQQIYCIFLLECCVFVFVWTFQLVFFGRKKTKVLMQITHFPEVSVLKVVAVGRLVSPRRVEAWPDVCFLSTPIWRLTSCLSQALWHKDNRQGQICQRHSAGTPASSHSNCTQRKRKMTLRVSASHMWDFRQLPSSPWGDLKCDRVAQLLREHVFFVYTSPCFVLYWHFNVSQECNILYFHLILFFFKEGNELPSMLTAWSHSQEMIIFASFKSFYEKAWCSECVTLFEILNDFISRSLQEHLELYLTIKWQLCLSVLM